MQTEIGGNNHHSQGPIIVPEFEDFEFKALDEGLGFHQKEEKPRWKSQAKTMVASSSSIHPTMDKLKRNEVQSSISRDQLGMIYSNDQQMKTTKNVSIASVSKAKPQLKDATLTERLSAQLADTFIITGSVAVMIYVMLKLAQVPNKEMLSLLKSVDVIPVVAVLWLVSYIAYFAILETRQTPGKIMMRLRVVELDGSGLSLSRSLERTAFRTLSWLALGFPLLMNFHGRLSRTKVIRS